MKPVHKVEHSSTCLRHFGIRKTHSMYVVCCVGRLHFVDFEGVGRAGTGTTVTTVPAMNASGCSSCTGVE